MHFRSRAAARQVQSKAKAHDAECRVSAQWRRRSWWWARLPPQYARLHLPFNEADRLTEGANTPVLSGFSGSMAEYGITPLRQLMLWFMQENQDSLQECNATSNRKTIICVLRHTLAFFYLPRSVFLYRQSQFLSMHGRCSLLPALSNAVREWWNFDQFGRWFYIVGWKKRVSIWIVRNCSVNCLKCNIKKSDDFSNDNRHDRKNSAKYIA